MQYLPAILALLIAAAGWFYLFYSKAAERLATIEDTATNRLRIRLRRVGGVLWIVLAGLFYAACVALERRQIRAAASYFMVVLILMAAGVVLGLVDLRLTHKLRRSQRKQDSE